jgi:hypothetical protein
MTLTRDELEILYDALDILYDEERDPERRATIDKLLKHIQTEIDDSLSWTFNYFPKDALGNRRPDAKK